MKRKKITALMLAGALAVSAFTTGCSGRIDQEAVVATLGDQEISLGLANFIARYNQAQTDNLYQMYMGQSPSWQVDAYGTGSTLEEDTKNSVMEQIELMYLLDQHKDDYKVSVTEDETKKMQEAAKQFMENNSKQAIKQIGATEEYIVEMLRLMTIQSKMKEAIEAEVDTNVSDEEAAQRTFSYVTVDLKTHQDDEGNTVDYTEDEITQLKKDTKQLAKKAAKDFDGAMEEAGYTASTYSYDANPDKDEDSDQETMADEVIEAADKLKEGEVSGYIEVKDEEAGTETAYILRLDKEFDEEATESKKESIISSRKSDHYTEVTDGYKKDAKWNVDSKQWKKVKFDSTFKAKQEETDTSDVVETTDVSDTVESTDLSTDISE